MMDVWAFPKCDGCGLVEVEPGFSLCLGCVDTERIRVATDRAWEEQREIAEEDTADALLASIDVGPELSWP